MTGDPHGEILMFRISIIGWILAALLSATVIRTIWRAHG